MLLPKWICPIVYNFAFSRSPTISTTMVMRLLTHLLLRGTFMGVSMDRCSCTNAHSHSPSQMSESFWNPNTLHIDRDRRVSLSWDLCIPEGRGRGLLQCIRRTVGTRCSEGYGSSPDFGRIVPNRGWGDNDLHITTCNLPLDGFR